MSKLRFRKRRGAHVKVEIQNKKCHTSRLRSRTRRNFLSYTLSNQRGQGTLSPTPDPKEREKGSVELKRVRHPTTLL
jgi:hypothetical protein